MQCRRTGFSVTLWSKTALNNRTDSAVRAITDSNLLLTKRPVVTNVRQELLLCRTLNPLSAPPFVQITVKQDLVPRSAKSVSPIFWWFSKRGIKGLCNRFVLTLWWSLTVTLMSLTGLAERVSMTFLITKIVS